MRSVAEGAAESAGGLVPGAPADNRPLAGIRILDFGWILSVPHCTAWLGTLGAEVIRVESMARLDLGRMGIAGAADGIPGVNRSASFNGLNYSKQSITLNVATPEGRALARELVKVSDVVTENFATGVMDRLGLGYEALREIKPDIIMLTGSTLGTSGPEREATGWGPNVCAYAGLPFISGYPDGPPADLGGIWPDYMIGTMMAFAVLSAVHHRNRTGEGQHVEVAMGEVVTAMIPEAVLDYTMNPPKADQRPRMGNRDERMAPHGVYRTRCAERGTRSETNSGNSAPPAPGQTGTGPRSALDDSWVAIAVGSDDEWQALCRAIGRPEWAGDPRFADVRGRLEHQDELEGLLGGWTRRHTAYEVMQSLQAVGVAAGPVLAIPDLVDDPHLQARGFLVEIDHPEVGRRPVAGLPARFSAMPALAYRPAPCLGEHNDQVLRGLLHLSAEDVQRLHGAKVVY